MSALAGGRLSSRSPWAAANLHQRMIAVTIDEVPGGQAGAIWLRGEDGLYRAAAAVGYDRGALSEVASTLEGLRGGPTN